MREQRIVNTAEFKVRQEVNYSESVEMADLKKLFNDGDEQNETL